MPPMNVDVDDGWTIEEHPSRSDRHLRRRDRQSLTKLLREALTILDGEPPREIALDGDGWSLIDPDRITRH